MSSDLSFEFRDQSVEIFITEDGKELFHGADVCRALGRSDNSARTIKTFVKPKWWIEYPNPKGGKPVLCLFEPGLYQLATNPIFNSEFASKFQDLVFEVVLPKIRASRGFIMPGTTSEEVQALVAEYQSLQKQNKLLADNRQLTGIVSDFLYSCLDYAPGKHVRSAEWSPAFKQWTIAKHGKEFYNQLNPTFSQVVVEIDRILKASGQPRKNRIHIDAENGLGDLENAVLKSKDDRQIFSQLRTTANYPSSVGE